jgi:nitrite reductase/ring-hydroxylating ferredoxin subunit
MEPVYYNDDEYRQILSILEELTDQTERLPYPEARELTTSLLQHFDLVHRESIARICQYLEQNAPRHYAKLKSDFTIDTLLKLYDITKGDLDTGSGHAVGFIPSHELKIITPIIKWELLGDLHDLKDRILYKENVRGNEIVFALLDGQVFAMKNECVDSILPLDQGSLEYNYITCPWHGCRYDLTTGSMLDKPQISQITFPTRIDGSGQIEIKVPIADK